MSAFRDPKIPDRKFYLELLSRAHGERFSELMRACGRLREIKYSPAIIRTSRNNRPSARDDESSHAARLAGDGPFAMAPSQAEVLFC